MWPVTSRMSSLNLGGLIRDIPESFRKKGFADVLGELAQPLRAHLGHWGARATDPAPGKPKLWKVLKNVARC
jgi:hypothetical protein